MIDTSIQLNNHNSYHATELFWADTFSVQTMTHITASFALYSDVVQAAADRIKIRFYTANGATVSETSHAFAVNTIWERVSVTVAVPATAEKAQICFLAGSYWWAEAKVEEGQTATPYAINAAGQLTWISPNGIYTGTVTAQQVIVSPLSGATEKDLESRLVTINSNAINLKATTDNNVSRLTTIEAGQIGLASRVGTAEGTISNHSIRLSTAEGAQITLRSDVDGALPKITKLTAGGVYTGELVASQITTGTLSADRIAASSITAAKIAAGTITADKIDVSDLFAQNITATGSVTGAKLYGATLSNAAASPFKLKVGSNLAVINGSSYYYSGLALFDDNTSPTVPIFSALGVNGDIYFQNRDGNNFMWTNSYGLFLKGDTNNVAISLSNSQGPSMTFGTGMNHGLGVDANGPYYIVSGNVTYFS